MYFDLHIHEKTHSEDSGLSLEQIVLEAKARGLDGIAVTDHDTLGLKPQAEILSERHGIHIFVGAEVWTRQGDLLVFGVDEIPAQRVDAQTMVDMVNTRGGATIAAHPYRSNGRGLGDVIGTLQGLTAIEGYNGRTEPHQNLKATELAERMGLPCTGGSDAHQPGEVGRYATYFKVPVHSERDLITALKAGSFNAVSLEGETESLADWIA